MDEEIKKTETMITVARRLTSSFLQAMPVQVDQLESYMYLVVQRKPGKDIPDDEYGTGVRIEAKLDFARKVIFMTIPLGINKGISDIEDFEPNWYEAVEAAFLSQIYACLR
jgi:hypothetical protein